MRGAACQARHQVQTPRTKPPHNQQHVKKDERCHLAGVKKDETCGPLLWGYFVFAASYKGASRAMHIVNK